MIDLTPLLTDLDAQIQEAAQQAQAAQIHLATLRGERMGMLRVVAALQQPQPIFTTSEDDDSTARTLTTASAPEPPDPEAERFVHDRNAG